MIHWMSTIGWLALISSYNVCSCRVASRYVRWTLASYPTGPSHASHLVPLLERATRRFVHEEQYRADIRLLKLWLLYAKYVESPRDIFRFLEGRQVGIKLSSFYEEWAMLEEQANKYAWLHITGCCS